MFVARVSLSAQFIPYHTERERDRKSESARCRGGVGGGGGEGERGRGGRGKEIKNSHKSSKLTLVELCMAIKPTKNKSIHNITN